MNKSAADVLSFKIHIIPVVISVCLCIIIMILLIDLIFKKKDLDILDIMRAR